MTSRFMGDSIEDFQVLELLGKGGFACVYRACCIATGQEVAIKMIDKKAMKTSGMVTRVINEVEIHCQLKHPTILELYNYFEDANYVYLILEMCHNGEINRYLKKTGRPVGENEARHIMTQVVKGVLYLHSHGILHRDLTLGNILLTRGMDAKIADFGLAARLTMPNEKHYTMCGTPNYISPEIATRGPHGLESDVWSLGCMLYTLLVGSPPFDTEAVKSTLNRVVLADYNLPCDMSSPAKDLISQLLKKSQWLYTCSSLGICAVALALQESWRMNPGDRITLSGILDHPFMTQESMLKYSSNHQLYPPQHVVEQSLDSGTGTMATVSTGFGRTSKSTRNSSEHTKSIGVQGNPNNDAFTDRSSDRQSDMWPRHGRHPPSPPVRQRASHSTSTTDQKTSSAKDLIRGTEVAPPPSSGYKPTANSASWLSNITTSTFRNKQPKALETTNGENNLVTKFKNYNASKYSSSCGNTLGDFLKNTTNGTNTSSSGFSSTETNLCRQGKDQQPAASDLNSRSFTKQTSADVNSSGCKETAAGWGDHRQHRRRGSNSVTKDSGLDFSHVQEDPASGMPVTQGGGEQRKKNQRNKSDMSRSKSLGDIVEPLNSERLRPIRQKTRTAVISIIDDGEVCLEFFHHKNGEDRVFEVLRISQNGMKISVYQPNGKSGVPLSLQPPSPPPGGCESTRTYLFSNLPSKYWKKYQYTTRFVHLVRKKTPKVTMYSKHARCMLMENTPHADFEVCFYNGAKVHQSQECTRIIEPGGVSYTLESVGGLEERVIRKEESNSNGGQYFPFTMCRKPPVSRKLPKGGDVQTEAHNSRPLDSIENLTATSPSTLAPVSTSLMSFDGTIVTTFQHARPSSAGHDRNVNRRSASCGDESETTSTSQCRQERRNQQSQLTAKGVSRQGSTVSPSSQVIKSVFVQGVGWASQLSTGEVWVQYNDGSQMVIQSSVTSIKYTDSQGTITRYSHSDRLPEPIKDKLSRLPVIIENLASSPKML
ncbi:Serine/threonine-protein kinase plk4 [Desmophyllum pertusum]|uniref:Serine/threonine-protein kinase PLK4 n=1 Tax=Desmophyllum pertusum TaxID=174260 RepID=A0A9X0DCG8_9CNID|nr:Serine/threonine-protein kinase plk4 [Desmophyllum pertusum]